MIAPVHPEFQNEFQYINKDLLKNFLVAAEQASLKRIAIIGGSVRDQLIHQILDEPLMDVKDLDILIEGSNERFVSQLQTNIGKDRLKIIRKNSSFHTIELSIDGLSIDIASARLENYPYPGENPKVYKSTLEEDLHRRDFTINAIALDLETKDFVDLYKGKDAILNRKIEFIHSKSVEEDPTRIFRAARYAARLDFKLAQNSINQIQETIKSWPWQWSHNQPPKNAPSALGTRLRMELELLFEENQWLKGIKYLQSWGALELLDIKPQKNNTWTRRFSWGVRLGLNPLLVLIAGSNNPKSLAERLDMSHTVQKLLLESSEISNHFYKLSESGKTKSWRAAKWCKEIESYNWQPESVAIAIAMGIPLWKPLFRWLFKWRLISGPTNANDLINNGWKQGPALGKELKRLREIELEKY